MRTPPFQLLGAVLMSTALQTVAATSTWTNLSGGNFNWSNAANWNPNGAPLSQPDTALSFFGAATLGNVTIQATNNIADPFLLNSLTLGGTAPASGSAANATLNLRGGKLVFSESAGVQPAINMAAVRPTGGSNLTFSVFNPVELATNLTVGGASSPFGVTLSGPVSGPGGIVKDGPNFTLGLGTSNSFTGPVTVNGLRLQVSSDWALGSTNAGTTVNSNAQAAFFSARTIWEPFVISGQGWSPTEGALRFGGGTNSTLHGPVTVANPALIKADGGSRFTINGDVNATGDHTLMARLDGTGSASTINGAIRLNGGSLQKVAGAPALVITSTNNQWSGSTLISQGPLQIGNGGYTGSLPDTVITNNGSLVFQSSNSFVLSQPIYGTGLIQARNYANLTLSASNAFTGILRLGTGGPIGGGLVRLLNNYALGDGSTPKTNELVRGELRLEGGIETPSGINFLTSGGSFITDLNGGGLIPIHNYSGTNQINGYVIPGGGGGDSEISVTSGQLTLAGTVAPSTTGRNLLLSGADGLGIVAGALNDGSFPLASLRKTGANTWRLDNAFNTYSGPTIVAGGTLALGPAATLPSTASLTLSNGATFDVSALPITFDFGFRPVLGSGTVSGAFSLSGGTVVPGMSNSLGTLTFTTNLALSFGALAVDLTSDLTPGQGSNDLVVVGGDFDGGASTVIVSPLSPLQVNSNYTIVTFSGARIGTLGTVTTASRYNLLLDESVPGQVRVKVASGGPTNLVWSDISLSGTWDSAGAVWNGNMDTFYDLDHVTFNDSGSSQGISLGGTLRPGSVTVSASTNYDFYGSGKISGSTGIAKSGAGRLSLANANDFLGPVTVNSGTLVISNNAALGSVAGGTVVGNGATLDIVGANLGLEPIRVSGAGVGGLGAIVNTGNEQQNALRNVTFDGDTTIGTLSNRFDFRAGTSTDPLLNAQGHKLTKKGAAVLSIVANHNALFETGLGDIDIEEGTVEFAFNPTLGNPARTMTVFPGATFRTYSTGTNILTKQLVMQAGSTFWNNSGSNTFAGPVSMAGNGFFLVSSNTSLTLSGPLASAGAWTNGGGGTLILTGSNDLTGGIYVTNGILRLAHSSAAGSTNTIITPNGYTGAGAATPRIDLSTGITVPPTVSLVLTSSATGDLRSTLSASGGTNEWTGPISVSGDGTMQFIADSTNVLILSGGITNIAGTNSQLFLRGPGYGEVRNTIKNPTGRLSKTDAGAWLLQATGHEWAQTRVVVGTLRMGQDDALPATASLYLGQDNNAAVLDLNGTRQTVSEIQNNATSVANYLIGSSSTNADSLLVFAGTVPSTFNSRIVDAVGAGSRKTAVTVSGSSLTLGGNNTYSGATTITNATLALSASGSLPSTQLIDVRDGGVFDVSALAGGYSVTADRTLTGSGTITGAVTIASAATLAPSGILTLQGNLTLLGTNVMGLAKSGATTSSDRVTAINTLTCGGVLKLVLSGDALAGGESFNLFSAATIAGTFSAIEPASPAGGLEWDTTDLYTLGVLKVKAPFQPALLGTVTLTGPNTVTISAVGGPNMTYNVFASTNIALPLASWWQVGSTNADSSGVIQFIDTTATNSPRFYIFGQ